MEDCGCEQERGSILLWENTKIASSLERYARKHDSWCDRLGRNLYLSTKNKQYGTKTLGHLLDAAG